MTSELPDPLTPADCDLRGLPFIPLDAQRLLDSDLFALSTGDEFKAAVALWCKSWFQVPAASLPNDDRILAHLSGAGAGWKKLREIALRNWILCSDGRLYHPVVAEKALEALPAREGYVARKTADAERKDKERRDRAALFELLRSHGHVMPYDTKTKDLRALASRLNVTPVTPPVTTPVTADVTPPVTPVTAKTGTGTGTVTTTPSEAARSNPSLDSDPGISPPRRVAVSILLRDLGVKGTYSHPTVVEWAQQGVTDEQLTEAVQIARMHKPEPALIPVGYLAPIVAEIRSPSAGATHAASRRGSPSATDRNIATIAGLTGRDRSTDPPVIDGTAERVG